jgi:hypothetical protein
MGVPADDHIRIRTAEQLAHALVRLHPRRMILAWWGQECEEWVARHTVNNQEIVKAACRERNVLGELRQPGQPLWAQVNPLPINGRGHHRLCPVCGPERRVTQHDVKLCVPEDALAGEAPEKIDDFGAPGKLVNEVAADNERVWFLPPQVGENRVESEDIAVDIAEDSNTHQ